MAPRLTAEFWVQAYLARLRGADVAAYVLARGDATAGAVLVLVATMDGRARVVQRSFDPATGERVWTELVAGSEAEAAAAVARARARDPDLWVIEIEDKAGRDLLETPGLSG